MTKVTVYTKEGRHLCERVVAELKELNKMNSFEMSIEDITTDPELFERYKNIIPAVAVNGKVKLAGAALVNPATLKIVLQKVLRSNE